MPDFANGVCRCMHPLSLTKAFFVCISMHILNVRFVMFRAVRVSRVGDSNPQMMSAILFVSYLDPQIGRNPNVVDPIDIGLQFNVHILHAPLLISELLFTGVRFISLSKQRSSRSRLIGIMSHLSIISFRCFDHTQIVLQHTQLFVVNVPVTVVFWCV